MQKLNTAAQMRHMDQTAMHGKFAIAPAVLMENAGHAVAAEGGTFVDGWAGKDVVIFCGKGNNGGDGFVIARHLVGAGARVYVYIMGNAGDYSDEATQHLRTLRQMANPDYLLLTTYEDTPAFWSLARHRLATSQVVIDALLGTGFHGNLRQPLTQLVSEVNEVAAMGSLTVIAVDIPTGVNADTGAVSGQGEDENGPLFAHLTVTFGALKRGLVCYPGRTCAGQVVLDGIGMPVSLLTEPEDDPAYVVEAADIAEILTPRQPDSHKGTHGTIGIVAGCQEMAGAALMAAHGAVRAGAGKVFLRVPLRTAAYCIGRQPEIMVRGVGKGGHFKDDDAKSVYKESKNWSVLAIGPGLGKDSKTKKFVKAVLENAKCPVVVDADALNLLVGAKDFVASLKVPVIFTPHLAEFCRLAEVDMPDVHADLIGQAKAFAKAWNVTLVLKGAPTVVVSAKTGNAYVNPTGNAGMACGGMGDVLTGMVAALVAHHGIADTCSAACAAVYLHGAAGDVCHETIGSYGFTPWDVADAVPQVIQKLEQQQPVPVLQRPMLGGN